MTLEQYENILHESLTDWFKKEKWVRINTQGNITGPCGTMKKGKPTTRCLPLAKARDITPVSYTHLTLPTIYSV